MEPTVTPIDATLGAVVTDLELARMDDVTWKAVERAFHERALLIFPGQHLAEEAQVAFANRFGDIELLAADPEQKAVAISNRPTRRWTRPRAGASPASPRTIRSITRKRRSATSSRPERATASTPRASRSVPW